MNQSFPRLIRNVFAGLVALISGAGVATNAAQGEEISSSVSSLGPAITARAGYSRPYMGALTDDALAFNQLFNIEMQMQAKLDIQPIFGLRLVSNPQDTIHHQDTSGYLGIKYAPAEKRMGPVALYTTLAVSYGNYVTAAIIDTTVLAPRGVRREVVASALGLGAGLGASIEISPVVSADLSASLERVNSDLAQSPTPYHATHLVGAAGLSRVF